MSEEKITMRQSDWEGHVSKEVLPGRFKFIEKAAKEGRLIKVEQEQGSKMAKCPKCKHNYVEVERIMVAKHTEELKANKVKVNFGKFITITFVINTGGGK